MLLEIHTIILLDFLDIYEREKWWCWNSLISRNIPHIHVHEKRGNGERWHGAEIQIVIEGNWTTYRVWFSILTLTWDSVSYNFTASFVLWSFFASAVQNTALHASNGCHNSICTISFQVSVRISRVLPLSLCVCVCVCACMCVHVCVSVEELLSALSY